MERNKRWSKEEEQVILDCIKKEGVNQGLLTASKKINRSYAACTCRYDKYLKKELRTKPKSKIARKRWTKDEIQLIKEAIAKNPNNISLCCEQLSTKLNRSPRAIYAEYRELKKSSVLFMTVGKKTQSPNTKNIPYDSSEKPKKHSIWSKLKKLLKLC